jgi:periplasmic divalent cation tolerance protein
MSVWVMLSTAGSLREAKRIAKTLVEEKLAACATVLPGALSYFYWEGKLSREKETLILAKTTARHSGKMMRKIKGVHSYQVPEILFFPAARGEKGYSEWVKKSTMGK